MAKENIENIDRKVPYSEEAEVSVLGAMLIDREAISVAQEKLTADCFYLSSHRRLFSAIAALDSKNIEVDPVTLTDQLEKDGALEEIGGRQYIMEIFGSVPTAAGTEYHSQIVLEKYMLRRLIESCTGIIKQSYEPVEEVDKLVDSAEQRILQIQDFRLKRGATDVDHVIHDIINDLEKRHQEKITITGAPSGFRDLDKKIIGFQNTNLVIIAGRPGMGKTSFCLNVALSLGCGTREYPTPVPVIIFSLEMDKHELVQRFLCSQARIDSNKMRTAQLTDLDWSNLTLAADRLHNSPIFIDDTPMINVLELRAIARRFHKTEKIGLVIVDYLQLMRGVGRQESRQQEISQISRSLKALAKELNIPIVALSQLNRAAEGRTDNRPQLADLRESGAIEQDADLVLFIYRPEVYKIEEYKGRSSKGVAEIIISKNRNGPVGEVVLTFEKKFTNFKNSSLREELEGM
ncbi:MAG: replicative DNA helicase [Gemmatimonadota bacterium]|nr:replicative DNA helicase [Gemmatimonadota bacterium]